MILLTKKDAQKILSLKGGEVTVSLDLGKTQTKVQTSNTHLLLEGKEIPLDSLSTFKEQFCYYLNEGEFRKLAFFSQESNLYYKLLPTADWPTITLSSSPMHRMTHTTPKQNAHSIMEEISPIQGKVLDTCCGLGYTAMLAAKSASVVHTFERDPYVVAIAKMNPFSSDLFSTKNIQLHEDDVATGIESFQQGFFLRIIHDPPTFKRSPELYSKEFHRQLFRVLAPKGILYHYAPLPHITKGEHFERTIIRNLKEAGFSQIKYHPLSAGVRAVKS